MRVLAILLANLMWLTPSVQVFANTMADTHCRAHGHISAAAPDAAQDSMHAQHHGAPQQNEDSEQCKCGCICGLAYMTGTALMPSPVTVDALTPEHFPAVFISVHPHSTHAVLQRPPISS